MPRTTKDSEIFVFVSSFYHLVWAATTLLIFCICFASQNLTQSQILLATFLLLWVIYLCIRFTPLWGFRPIAIILNPDQTNHTLINKLGQTKQIPIAHSALHSWLCFLYFNVPIWQGTQIVCINLTTLTAQQKRKLAIWHNWGKKAALSQEEK